MRRLGRLLGLLWAGPLTVVGLLWAAPLGALGWYTWAGVQGDALVWLLDRAKAPAWYAWKHRTDHTVGRVVMLDASLDAHHGRAELRHEQAHVAQHMRLGPLFPLARVAIWLSMVVACRKAHPHFDHPFELDARRAAGQVIDVVGLVERTRRERPS